MDKKESKLEFMSFDSFEEADKYNEEYYASLTPDQRLEIALQIVSVYNETYPRLEKVFRTAELGECPVSSDRWMGT